MWENISIVLLVLYNVIGVIYNLIIYDVIPVDAQQFILLVVLCNAFMYYIYASLVTFYHATKANDPGEIKPGVWHFFFHSLMHPLMSIRLLPIHKRIIVLLVVVCSLLNNWGLELDNKGLFRFTVSLQSLAIRMILFISLNDNVENLSFEQIIVSPFYYLDDPYTFFDKYIAFLFLKFNPEYRQLAF